MGRYFSHKPHKDSRIIPSTPEEIQEALNLISIIEDIKNDIR